MSLRAKKARRDRRRRARTHRLAGPWPQDMRSMRRFLYWTSIVIQVGQLMRYGMPWGCHPDLEPNADQRASWKRPSSVDWRTAGRFYKGDTT